MSSARRRRLVVPAVLGMCLVACGLSVVGKAIEPTPDGGGPDANLPESLAPPSDDSGVDAGPLDDAGLDVNPANCAAGCDGGVCDGGWCVFPCYDAGACTGSTVVCPPNIPY